MPEIPEHHRSNAGPLSASNLDDRLASLASQVSTGSDESLPIRVRSAVRRRRRGVVVRRVGGGALAMVLLAGAVWVWFQSTPGGRGIGTDAPKIAGGGPEKKLGTSLNHDERPDRQMTLLAIRRLGDDPDELPAFDRARAESPVESLRANSKPSLARSGTW